MTNDEDQECVKLRKCCTGCSLLIQVCMPLPKFTM